MALGTFKTLVNVGMNISNDYTVPVHKTLEKNKNYEVRLYDSNKYILIKYKTIDDGDKKKKSTKNQEDKGDDIIMKHVWRIMKYTQGENDQKLTMKLCMPVFVHIETLTNGDHSDIVATEPIDNNNLDKKLIEVKILVSLPPDYQVDKKTSKEPLEPPVPLEADIQFEVLPEFKCYVRSFSGFAGDAEFKNETSKLKESLKEAKNETINIDDNKLICISYDPPYKLINRRNEVIVFSKTI